MSKTVGDLKKAVAAYMCRDATAFVVDTFDNLLQACNNARVFIERAVMFEYSRVQVQVDNVSLTNGASLTTAYLLGGSSVNDKVSVRQVIWPFLQVGSSGKVPINWLTRDQYLNRIKRRFDAAGVNNTNVSPVQIEIAVFQLGTTLVLIPGDATTVGGAAPTVYLDVYRWLPVYTDNAQNDFLLDFAFDYMVMACVEELNFFLKEDQRVPLCLTRKQVLFDSVRDWNAAINASTDVNL